MEHAVHRLPILAPRIRLYRIREGAARLEQPAAGRTDPRGASRHDRDGTVQAVLARPLALVVPVATSVIVPAR